MHAFCLRVYVYRTSPVSMVPSSSSDTHTRSFAVSVGDTFSTKNNRKHNHLLISPRERTAVCTYVRDLLFHGRRAPKNGTCHRGAAVLQLCFLFFIMRACVVFGGRLLAEVGGEGAIYCFSQLLASSDRMPIRMPIRMIMAGNGQRATDMRTLACSSSERDLNPTPGECMKETAWPEGYRRESVLDEGTSCV